MATRNWGYNTPPGMKPGEVWEHTLSRLQRLSRADRAKKRVVIIGSGLSGLSAAIACAGANVPVTLIYPSDSGFRAHSVAAQGGINSNFKIDHADSDERYVRDTLVGGDFLASEWQVNRTVSLSSAVIDHLAHWGTPFSVDFAGMIDARTFGGVHDIRRTAFVAGETGKHLMKTLHAGVLSYVHSGMITEIPHSFVLDLITHDGRAQGVVLLDMARGKVVPVYGDAVVVATGGYASMYYRSTNADDSNGFLLARLLEHGARFCNPRMVQFHPTAMYFKTAAQLLMTEALRNHARFWVPRAKKERDKTFGEIPTENRWYFMEELYPQSGNLVPRDIASRELTKVIHDGFGVGPGNRAVYLDMTDAVQKYGREDIKRLYGNVLQMYQDCSGVDAYASPMLISPTAHFSMGGIEVDHLLQSAIPGMFVIGEAASSIHGANRLGANSLLQAIIDGLFLTFPSVQHYFSNIPQQRSVVSKSGNILVQYWHDELHRLTHGKGNESVLGMRQELGDLLYTYAGVTREASGLKEGNRVLCDLTSRLPGLAVHGDLAWNTVLIEALVLRGHTTIAKLLLQDAQESRESRGAHWRTDYPKRDDSQAHMSSWGTSDGKQEMVKRPLTFAEKIAQRSY